MNSDIYYQVINDYSNDVTYTFGYQDCNIHCHQQLELIFCEQGEMSIVINGEEKLIKKGQVAIVNSFDSHKYKHLPFSCSTSLIIPIRFLKAFNDYMLDKDFISKYITNEETCKLLFEYKAKLIEHNDNNSFITKGYVNLLLGLIIKDNITTSKGKEEYSLVKDIILYIEKNYKNDINLDILAENFNYSKYYFSHIFNELFQCNLNDYVNLVRVNHTITSVTVDGMDYKKAAIENGFNSDRTFYRAFEKFYSMSPKEYFTRRHLYNKK